MAKKSYTGYRQYCRSKLMTLMFTIELARRLSGTSITANAVHPGFVRTAIARDFGWQSRFFDLRRPALRHQRRQRSTHGDLVGNRAGSCRHHRPILRPPTRRQDFGGSPR